MAAAVRLVFGSPLGLLSAGDVALLLGELGIHAGGVQPARRPVWGVAKYEAAGTGAPGAPGRIGIAVYGRDAADARLLTKVGRFLLYRDSGPELTITRLQQVEHEAYLTFRAARAGAAVPDIIEAGKAGPSGGALLVYRMPGGMPLADADAAAVSDAIVDDLYRQLLTLRRARIAHGAVSGDAIVIDPVAQAAVLADFRNAAVGASPGQLDRDLAGALAATAVAAGPDRAATAAAIDVPALVEPRRVSWSTLIMIIGTLIGGWALIGVLIDVSKSFGTVIGASWLWVVMAFVLAQLAFAASAVEAAGSVAGPLPFGRALAVEVANSFSALAGGTPAVFAARVRFFQTQGYDASVALSSGAIMTVSSWTAITVLFLCSLPFAWGSIHLEVSPQSGGDSRLVWLILAAVVLAAVLAGMALAMPRLRRLAAEKLRPRLRDIWANLTQVASSPRKLVLLFGGSFAGELFVAMALSVSLRPLMIICGCPPSSWSSPWPGSSVASRRRPAAWGWWKPA